MTTYKINKNTTTLLPAKQIGYETRIIEQDKEYDVTDTAIEIIEHTCREDWASYEVRREIVSEKTGYMQKVPIPVNINEKIITMPTHSPQHMDCMWIILNRHTRIHRNKNRMELVINDYPYESIPFNASVHTITSQIKRAKHIQKLLQQK